MSLTILAIVTGIGIGSVYSLIAVGYTVVFQATRVFNLAQGDLVMLAVMLSWYLLTVEHWSEIGTAAAVLVGVTLVSVVEERLIVRPFVKRKGESIGWFIATLAFSLIIETIIVNLYGNQPPQAVPPLLSGAVRAGNVIIEEKLLLATGALLVVTMIMEAFYRLSWTGTAMRALSEDRELATIRGIDANRFGILAFAIGGAVAAVAGFFVAPIVSSNPSVGLDYGLQGFIAMAIGGFGSTRGAVAGGWLLGIAEQLLDRYYTANYEIVAAAAVLMAVLLLRPTGLFRSTELRRV